MEGEAVAVGVPGAVGSLPDDVLAEVMGFLPLKACRALSNTCTYLSATLLKVPTFCIALEGCRLTSQAVSVLRARPCPLLLNFQDCIDVDEPSVQLLLGRKKGMSEEGSEERGKEEIKEQGQVTRRDSGKQGLSLVNHLSPMHSEWPGLGRLAVLDLGHCRPSVTDPTLLAFADHCGALRSLGLSQAERVTDRGVCALVGRSAASLQHILLNGCVRLTEATLFTIAHCHGLLTCDLSFSGAMSSRGVAAIATGCPSLQALDLSDTRPADGPLAAAAVATLFNTCKSLRDLVLHSASDATFSLSVSGASSLSLAGPFLALQTLGVGEGARLTTAGLLCLPSMFPALRRLSLSRLGRVSPAATAALAKLPELAFLSFLHCPYINDQCVQALFEPSTTSKLAPTLESPLRLGTGTLVISKCPLVSAGAVLSSPPSLRLWCNGQTREQVTSAFDLFDE